MRHCPSCASANPDDFRFCRQCGAALVRELCPACGAPHDHDQAFCGQCGTALAGPIASEPMPGTLVAGDLAPSEAGATQFEERKLATVLFADVVGFTSLAERTDPETVARMVDAVFRQMAAVVTEHGGTVDKYMGDCLMAVFGVPVAHGDDAARAVAAALAMSRLGGDLVFSMGINSGEVMATTMGGTGDVTVIGDAVNVAARLEKAAGPGQILCGSLTAELARSRAAFAPRQPILLKGKQGPVEVWEATALAPVGPGAASDLLPPLIGRTQELAYLLATYDTTLSEGRAQVAVVCGEAGAGKTRLLDELARTARSDAVIVRASHPAYGATGAERLAADVLRQLGPIHADDVSARVWSLTGTMDESLKDIEPASLAHEQLWALSRLLEEKTATGPLLLLLDDMHWSGESVLGLLGGLRGRVLHMPILLVIAGRSEPGEWLHTFAGATTIRVDPLGRRHSAELAAALAGERPLSDEAAEFLGKRSGGNPLYLRELIRMAKGMGSLVEEGGRYHLSSSVTVPASLHAVLAARLDSLPPAHKEVFQHAAVLGEGATATAIGAIGNHSAEALLADLVAAGLLRAKPDGTFVATEPMMREVAYETLPFRVRSRLHRRAASIVGRGDEQAHHLERAAFFGPDDPDLTAEAAALLAETGMQLVEQSRLPEARHTLARAVELGAREPAVLLSLGRLHEEASDPNAAAEVIAMVADDPAVPALAIERDHVAARLKMFTDPEPAVPLLEAVASRWQQAGDQVKQAWAIANAGVASFAMGQMEQAADRLDRARLIFESNDDQAGAVATSSFLCLVRPADPRVPAWLVDGLVFADRTGDRSKQLSALTPLAWHHFVRTMWGAAGQTVEAERFAHRLSEVAEELGVTATALQARCLLALAARYSGRLTQAAEHARSMETLLARHPHGLLSAAAAFSSAVASGAIDSATPFNPPYSQDPVALIATQVVGVELLLAGRVDESLAYLVPRQAPGTNLQIEMSGVMTGLALAVSGRQDQALPWVDRAERAARLLSADVVGRLATALRAELANDVGALPRPEPGSLSIGEAVVLRAHAALGDPTAVDRLVEMAGPLAAPGLTLGIPASASIRSHPEREPT